MRPLRITRWTSILLNYNFEVEHKKGSTNVVADAFSPLPVFDTEGDTLFEEGVVSDIVTPLSNIHL